MLAFSAKGENKDPTCSKNGDFSQNQSLNNGGFDYI
jgi:hypothetical protein